MEFGLPALLIGIFLLIVDLIFLVLINYDKRLNKFIFGPLTLAIGFVLFSFFIFINSLITLDFSYAYVANHVSEGMDYLIRIASAWSGQAGSYFVWAMYVFVIYVVFRLVFRSHIEEALYQRIFIIINFNAIALLILVIINNPFLTLVNPPSFGTGLIPILDTFWNIIHPPVVLLAYALFLIPFAISISRYSLGKEFYTQTTSILPLRRFSMAVAWFVITIGLALGGYWAYVTLQWGGFWAWDPVETGSLVPWIFATIFFHNSPGLKEKEMNYDKDLYAIIPFLTVLFATLITRSGLLDSVHTFALSNLVYFLLIYALITLFVVILLFVRNREIQLFHSWNFLKTMPINDLALYIAYLALLFGALGVLYGLVVPIALILLNPIWTVFVNIFGEYLFLYLNISLDPNLPTLIVDQKFFNSVIGIFGFVAIISTFFLDFMYPKKLKTKIYSIFAVILFGFFLAVISTPEVNRLFFNTPFSVIYDLLGILITTSYLANVIIPLALFSMVSAIVGTLRNYKSTLFSTQVKIRKISQTVLHIGIMIALIGALYSSNLTSSYSETLNIGDEMSLSTDGSLTLELTESNLVNIQGGAEFANLVRLKQNGQIIAEGYVEVGIDDYYGFYSTVLIIPSIYEDVHISGFLDPNKDLGSGGISSLTLNVEKKPLIWMLWIGIIIIVLSMIPILIISFQKLKNQYNFQEKINESLTMTSENLL